ncbi:MAG: aminoglycoside phosphotransferase family protein [Bacteroidota bacterium]|nr:aminoglycoside phosphotransferase family protein [Bacteroidota bacterium]
MRDDLERIYSLFLADGSFSDVTLFGSGHIHETFYVKTFENEKDDYILQKLNNKVFKNIPELQDNIERVTLHIRSKLLSIPGSDVKRECLNLVMAKSGKSWIIDQEGNFWRMFIYIPDHRSYDLVDSPRKAYEGGKAVGRFQALLADLPGKPLHETIPNFHNVVKRLENFNNSISKDSVRRVSGLKHEINFVLYRASEMKVILNLGKEGRIPLTITHNDTKFNNILLDKKDRALCIIDLDTVMPGYVHYDFGDAIRTAANVAAEDEQDLEKVKMDINLFKAYAEGYLSETRGILNETEKDYLAFAPRLITYIMGLRFLTDYIDGDVYYKIHHKDHNIQRARAQFRLLESMEEQYPVMQKIIESLK